MARSTIGNIAASIPGGIRTVTVPTKISIAGLGAIGIAGSGGADGSNIPCAGPNL
jgi:hypothetical protein